MNVLCILCNEDMAMWRENRMGAVLQGWSCL